MYNSALRQYSKALVSQFGRGWNRFWFEPSDPFTLGLLRILVGAVGSGWLISYSFDLQPLFGPQGLLSQATIAQWRGTGVISLLDFANSSAELWVAHVLAICVFLMFTVGLFTRTTAILSLLAMVSYLWRAPMLAGPLEDILAMAMFYLCLSPCGKAWSVDRWLARRRAEKAGESLEDTPQTTSWATVPTRLMQVHLTAVYLGMALAQCRGAVWWTGEAVWWMAARSDMRLLDLTWLHAHPDVVAIWTHAIVLGEFLFAILVWNRLARPLVLAWAALMWASLALLTGSIGFSLLMISASLVFVPGHVLRSLFASPSTADDTETELPEPNRRQSRTSEALRAPTHVA